MALADRDEIMVYIAQDNSIAAIDLDLEFEAKVENARAGRTCTGLAGSATSSPASKPAHAEHDMADAGSNGGASPSTLGRPGADRTRLQASNPRSLACRVDTPLHRAVHMQQRFDSLGV
jgi:hypothetical protein